MGDGVTHDERDLIAAAAAGDQTAFRTLYRRYARPVYWVAHGALGHVPDAEDVLQDTFLVAWRRLPELELLGDSLLPWLVTICRFQCANRIRRRQRDRAHTTALDETVVGRADVEDHVIGAELTGRVLAAVNGLSPLDREIFRLCAADGLSYEAAAGALGVSHGTVRNRLSRVRGRLRALVETEESA